MLIVSNISESFLVALCASELILALFSEREVEVCVAGRRMRRRMRRRRMRRRRMRRRKTLLVLVC